MIKRLKQISEFMSTLAGGDFRRRVAVSDKMDETDELIGGLHMLAEELEAVTISRDHFRAVFQAINDMAVILSPTGIIEQVNQSTLDRLGYTRYNLVGRPAEVLTSGVSLWSHLKRHRGPNGLVRLWNRTFVTTDGVEVLVDVTARPLPLVSGASRGSVLLIAEDIGPHLDSEMKAERAAIDAEEREKRRLAQDLHDGVGQQITAALFLIEVVKDEKDEQVRGEKIKALSELLSEMVNTIQTVSEDLMPKTLEEFGLVTALRELGDEMTAIGLLRVSVAVTGDTGNVPEAIGLDLFRVTQEFMTNAVRHGRATWMEIRLSVWEEGLTMELREDGKGFEMAEARRKGRGLYGMYARIRTHQGSIQLSSRRGMGTTARICVTWKN